MEEVVEFYPLFFGVLDFFMICYFLLEDESAIKVKKQYDVMMAYELMMAWWPSGLSRLLSKPASASVGSNPADGRP